MDKPPAAEIRILSGGQTGVDRAGLDMAIGLGLDHGGWCPRGRLAEDGTIPALYQLRETDSPLYAVRTEQNVIDSDATLILYLEPLEGGTELTRRLARRHGRPCLLIDLERPPPADTVRQWIRETGVRVLNIAGPRESQRAGIYRLAREYLELVFPGVGS